MGPYLIVVVILFILLASFVSIYTRYIADMTLTDQFRAAESITNGRFPQKWAQQINRRLAWNQRIPALLPEISGTKQALRKLDSLIRFFEKSPFFEDATARETLLKQLNETRLRWETMTWDEILVSFERQPDEQRHSP